MKLANQWKVKCWNFEMLLKMMQIYIHNTHKINESFGVDKVTKRQDSVRQIIRQSASTKHLFQSDFAEKTLFSP